MYNNNSYNNTNNQNMEYSQIPHNPNYHSINEIDDEPSIPPPPSQPVRLDKPSDYTQFYNQGYYNQQPFSFPPPIPNQTYYIQENINENNIIKGEENYNNINNGINEEKFTIKGDKDYNIQEEKFIIKGEGIETKPYQPNMIHNSNKSNYEPFSTSTPTSTTTTTTSTYESYDSKNSKLFYSIWKNKLIKCIIMYHLKIYNQANYSTKEFYTLKSFNESKEKYYLGSIKMTNIFENGEEILEFFRTLPENITSLEFKNKIPFLIDIERLVLPPSLTNLNLGPHHLTLPYYRGENYEAFSILQYLNTLKLPANVTTFKTIKFPSLQGLTSIDMGSYYKKIPIGSLPSTLKHIRFNGAYKKAIVKGVLPESLESITFSSDYPHCNPYLPKNLKLVRFERGSQNIDPAFLKCIPSSVTSLQLYCIFSDPIKSLYNDLPSKLKRLTLVGKLDKNCFKPSLLKIGSGFPSSLTKLDLSGCGFLQKIDVDHLPSTLRIIKLSISCTLDGEPKKGFPASLTSLKCNSSFIAAFKSFQNPSGLEKLKLSCSIQLSSSVFDKFTNLKSIVLYHYLLLPIEQFIPKPLPRTVTNFEIVNLTKEMSICSPPSLNKSIKSLKLDKTYTISYLEKSNYDESFSIFPDNLQLLDIDFVDSSHRDIPPINYLPNTLKVLIVRGSPQRIIKIPSSVEFIWHQNNVLLPEYESLLESNKNLTIKTFDPFNDFDVKKENGTSLIYKKAKNYICKIYNYNTNLNNYLINQSKK